MEHDYNHLLKRKKLFVRVVSALKRAASAMHHKGLEIQTIMFVPHSEKRIFNFHLYNYTIAFAVLLLVGLVVLAVVTALRRERVSNDELTALRAEDRRIVTTLKRYKSGVRDLEREYAGYESSIRAIERSLGIEVPDNAAPAALSSNERAKIPPPYEYPGELDRLVKIKAELETARASLTNISKILDIRRMLVAAIPAAWPVKDYAGQRTSGFGLRSSPFSTKRVFHKGVDIAYLQGTPIIAAADGTVIFAGWLGGYGQTVMVEHKFGFITLYGHNYRLNVTVDQRVRRGQTISFMGKTGKTTGVHLHYEVRLGNVPVDPWPYMTTRF